MRRIVSITIGTTILLLAISSFESVERNYSDELTIEVGEPSINTPDDIAQYLMELQNEESFISEEQVL